MLDLNRLLLFIAVVSPLILLARSWKVSDSSRAWRTPSIVVLVITLGGWLIARSSAGFVGAGAWLVLLLVPALAVRRITELSARENFGSARRLLNSLRLIHPSRGLRQQRDVLRALELAQTGEAGAAEALLARVGGDRGDHAVHALAQRFRVRGDWAGLIGWFRAALPPATQRTDFGLLPLYLRGLGEIGARDEMVREFAARAHVLLSQPQHAAIFHACLLPVLAFCGRTQPLQRLLVTTLPKLAHDAQEFWIAVGEEAAGDAERASERFRELRDKSRDALVRGSAARRLDTRTGGAPVSLSRATEQLLRPFERERPAVGGPFGENSARPTAAVSLLILVNLIVFVIELTHGGSTNPLTLHRLGQLEPLAVRYNGEYWRMFTALFLHYGPLHLAFNLYALWVIGPGLERAIGAARFLLCYLATGLGSSAGVVLLRLSHFTASDQLVGASGCVMGIVGVWVGSLLRHRDAPLAGRRLRNIFVIVAIQTAFDLSTPQISMTAHLSGLITGVVLGFAIAPRRLRI
ncbi:MAG: rhomboid family intramembrane serine protease [Verrucomicrobiota bacterium]|nr:rhomboid family intramembrane serine protease [Verrucomicrobiota bacterium]